MLSWTIRFAIIFILVVSTQIGVFSLSNVFAQLEAPWKTYTSEECKMSFQYPSSWIIKAKQGTFDTSPFVVGVYDPTLNLTDVFPSFGISSCMETDVINMVTSMPIVKNFVVGNVTNSKSLSILSEQSFLMASAMTGMANFTETMAPELTIVKHTTISPKLIGGRTGGNLYLFREKYG